MEKEILLLALEPRAATLWEGPGGHHVVKNWGAGIQEQRELQVGARKQTESLEKSGTSRKILCGRQKIMLGMTLRVTFRRQKRVVSSLTEHEAVASP